LGGSFTPSEIHVDASQRFQKQLKPFKVLQLGFEGIHERYRVMTQPDGVWTGMLNYYLATIISPIPICVYGIYTPVLISNRKLGNFVFVHLTLPLKVSAATAK